MSQRLRMKFGCQSGDTRTISLEGPKANLSASAAGAAMNSLVTAGAAFADPLTSALRAEVVETTTTVLVNNEN